MTLKERFIALKKLVFDTATPAAKEYKLKDGTAVSITDLAAGGDVIINGAPAKAGDYVLDDGSKFTVGNDGKISAVTMAAAPAVDPNAPAPIADTLADGTAISYDKLDVGGIVKGADGSPLPAGNYELSNGTLVVLGDGGVISTVTPGSPEMTIDEEMKTTAGRAAFASRMKQVFDDAAANNDATVQKLATCVKALMACTFGWDIRQQEELASRQAAIDVYKTGFAATETGLKKELAESKKLIEAQQKQIVALLEFVQELAEMPTGEVPEEIKTKMNFGHISKVSNKKEQFGKYFAAMEEMKKN